MQVGYAGDAAGMCLSDCLLYKADAGLGYCPIAIAGVTVPVADTVVVLLFPLSPTHRLVSSSPMPGAGDGAAMPVMSMEHPSVQQAFHVLKDHMEAIAKLQAQLKR